MKGMGFVTEKGEYSGPQIEEVLLTTHPSVRYRSSRSIWVRNMFPCLIFEILARCTM